MIPKHFAQAYEGHNVATSFSNNFFSPTRLKLPSLMKSGHSRGTKKRIDKEREREIEKECVCVCVCV